MSEHNALKPRTCKTCNRRFMMTAKELKEHGADCRLLNIDARKKHGVSILSPVAFFSNEVKKSA